MASLIPIVLNELRLRKIRLVYLASDDPLASQQIQSALGDHAHVIEQPRVNETGYTSRGYADEGDLMTVLIDVEALRRATVFIGTASSNIGRLVYFLRDKGSPSVSLD